MDWYEIFPSGTPTFIYATQMAYDRTRGRMVLYGGRLSGGGTTTDLRTWELYGGAWHAVTTAAAPTITGGTDAPIEGWMVFDESRDVCVLFFYNQDGSGTCEIWEYDGSDWTQFGGTVPQRQSSAGVYVTSISKTLFWGGGPSLSGSADTTYYTYDGSSVSSHTTAAAPTQRNQLALAYDRDRDEVVMVGGYTGVTPPSSALRPNDTWTLNPSAGTPNWTQESPATTPFYDDSFPNEVGESQNKAAFSEQLGKVLLAKPGADHSTWLWDGTNWTDVQPTVEPANDFGNVQWNPEYNRIHYYGGADTTSWLFPANAFRPQIYRRLFL